MTLESNLRGSIYIYKTAESLLCRMYRLKNKTVSYIVSKCEMLTQNEYKKRHAWQCMQAYSLESL